MKSTRQGSNDSEFLYPKYLHRVQSEAPGGAMGPAEGRVHLHPLHPTSYGPGIGRGKWGKADHRGKVNHPPLIHLPELPSSFRDSHYLRVTLLHVLNVMTRRYD